MSYGHLQRKMEMDYRQETGKGCPRARLQGRLQFGVTAHLWEIVSSKSLRYRALFQESLTRRMRINFCWKDVGKMEAELGNHWIALLSALERKDPLEQGCDELVRQSPCGAGRVLVADSTVSLRTSLFGVLGLPWPHITQGGTA